MHASPPADLQQTDTYFIVAHFHYVLFGGSIMGIFAGIYHYFPKMTGRLMNEKLGKLALLAARSSAMNLTFFPMHFSGLLGMPRRIYTYDAGQGWDAFNLMSHASARASSSIATADLRLQLLHAAASAARSPATNPWDAGTLEWSIPSPPPEYNFARDPARDVAAIRCGT